MPLTLSKSMQIFSCTTCNSKTSKAQANNTKTSHAISSSTIESLQITTPHTTPSSKCYCPSSYPTNTPSTHTKHAPTRTKCLSSTTYASSIFNSTPYGWWSTSSRVSSRVSTWTTSSRIPTWTPSWANCAGYAIPSRARVSWISSRTSRVSTRTA